ncbi:MAG: AAA family ATPase [Casimicrobiaceae bacterium]
MTAVIFSRGRDQFDAHPTQRVLPSFDVFEDAVLRDRSPQKGQAYIAAPFKVNGAGLPHRCKEGALPRVWLPFDLDGMRDGAAFVDLCLWLQRFRGFAYTTASHRPDAPRARLVLLASRPVDRTEGQRVCLALERDIKVALGDEVAQFDGTVYRGEQPCFTPLTDAETFRFDGAAVDIDSLLATAPEIDEAPGTAERAKTAATHDPILRHLADSGMVKRQLDDGRYAVVCPCADSHSSESNETSTVYMLPNFAGVKYGKFHCQHDHCRDRKQDAFIVALGLDPKRVWRAQATAGAPEASEGQPDTPNATANDYGLCVLNLGELLIREFPERDAILRPWLASQSLTMIHSWRGVGMTHMALGIAYAVATGGKFLTWEAPRPRRVLYLDGEMPATAIRDRLKALVESDERDFDSSYFLIITPDAQSGPMPDLATREGQDAIEGIADENGTELVIVDNVSTLCRNTAPENDAESWRAPQEWALRMRRAGRSVLFVHHSGKGGAQRGSSKREDTLDVVITLKRPADYSPEQDARFEIHFEKYRHGAGDDARPIEAMLTKDGNGSPCWTWRSVEDSTFDRVVALANEGIRPGEIAAELGINKSNVSRHMKRGRSEGRITAGCAS